VGISFEATVLRNGALDIYHQELVYTDSTHR